MDPIIDTIYSQSNKFVMGVKIKAIDDLKLNKLTALPLLIV